MYLNNIPIQKSSQNYYNFGPQEPRMVLGTTRAIKASSAPQKYQLEAVDSRLLLRALVWLTTVTAVA
jgi:hypothetical protein